MVSIPYLITCLYLTTGSMSHFIAEQSSG